MATLRKRGPRQWQAQVRRKGYPLESKSFTTRAGAERWARGVESEMDQGSFVSRSEAESTTLEELLRLYLDKVTPLKKGLGPETNRLRMLMRHPVGRELLFCP